MQSQQRSNPLRAPARSDALSLYVSRVRLPRTLAVMALVSDGLLGLSGAAFWSAVSLGLIGAELVAISLAIAASVLRHRRDGGATPARICQLQMGGAGLALLLSLVNFSCRRFDPGRQVLLPLEIGLTAISAGLLVLAARLWRDISALLRAEALAEELEDAESA